MFQSSFPSSASPASSATNYQYHRNSDSNSYLLHATATANSNSNAIHLPSYFASYSHFKEVDNDQPSGSGEMQGYDISAGEVAAAGTGKASRYSAEERKERIERYRSKRNLRNFQKKITYECRKTLADSRPRVRGRFAKNAETESETDTPESSNGNGNADAWWQMEADLISAEKCEAQSGSFYDDDLWAQLVSDFSANV